MLLPVWAAKGQNARRILLMPFDLKTDQVVKDRRRIRMQVDIVINAQTGEVYDLHRRQTRESGAMCRTSSHGTR